MDDVTLQYLESVIASEFGVTAALLLRIGFTARFGNAHSNEHLPAAYQRLALAVVVGVTLFGSLLAYARRREPEPAGRRDDRLSPRAPILAPHTVTGSMRGKDP